METSVKGNEGYFQDGDGDSLLCMRVKGLMRLEPPAQSLPALPKHTLIGNILQDQFA